MTCEIASRPLVARNDALPCHCEEGTDEAIHSGCFELIFDLATVRWPGPFSPFGETQDEMCLVPSCDGSGIFPLKSGGARV